MMGKDNQRNQNKGYKTFSSGSFLVVFIKEFIKFDSLIEIYFHENAAQVPMHERVEALNLLASNLKIMKDEEYTASLCRKFRYLMENKIKYLLNQCKSRQHPFEYTLLLGPRWLRMAEPRIQLLPIVANQIMSTLPANNSWGVWELNTELIQNAIRAIKSGLPMTDPVVVQDLSNTMNIDTSMILEHWVRACSHVRQAINSLKSPSADRLKGENQLFVDWTVADFLLMYDPSLTVVTQRTFSYKEHLLMLNELYTLTSLYNIEQLLLEKNYSELLEAWMRIYTSFTRSVINLSMVYLQRSWHELKYQARSQMIQYLKRNMQPPVPDKLLQDIVSRYKSLVHDPFARWSDVVDSNLVVQVRKFGEKTEPIACSNRIDANSAGPSRTNVDANTTKQTDNTASESEVFPASPVNKEKEDDSPNRESCASIDLLNNIDPSKATVRLIFESDSDDETVDASQTGSTHGISDAIEFEEHTLRFNMSAENGNTQPVQVEKETQCVNAEIESMDAQRNETENDAEETENQLSANVEKIETSHIDVDIENTTFIDAVEPEMESYEAINMIEGEIAANVEIGAESMDGVDTVICENEESIEDLVTVLCENDEARDENEQNGGGGERVTTERDKLLMTPIVPLEKCDLTASWILHSTNNTIDVKKYNPPHEKLPEVVPEVEDNMEITEQKIEEPDDVPLGTDTTVEQEIEPETGQCDMGSSRRVRETCDRRQNTRVGRIVESQIRSVLSSLSKKFLDNQRNVKLMMECRPLTVDLVRLGGLGGRPRAAKRVELPDIAQVRKINSTMLTAEINKTVRATSAPPRTSASASNIPSYDTLSQSENMNSPENVKATNPDPMVVEEHLTVNDQVDDRLRIVSTPGPSPVIKVFKRRKTNADYCRQYYYKRKAAIAERQRLGLSVERPIKKTGAERNRAYRMRKKILAQANELLMNEDLPATSTSTSVVMTTEHSSQPVTIRASTSRPDDAMVSSSIGPVHHGNNNQSHDILSPQGGTNSCENGESNPATLEKHLSANPDLVANESEKMVVTPSDTESDPLPNSNKVSVIVRSGTAEMTPDSCGDGEDADGIKMVSDMHCIVEQKSSLITPRVVDQGNSCADEDLPVTYKPFRIVRIVRSGDHVTSVPPKDGTKDTSSEKPESVRPSSKEKKNNGDNDEDNVKLSLMRDKLRKDRKRRAIKEQDNEGGDKQVFVNAHEKWLHEKQAALKYFQLPNVTKRGVTSRPPQWKRLKKSKITNKPQVIKVFSQKKAVADKQPEEQVAEQKQDEHTAPLPEISKDMEMQSDKEQQPASQSAFIDLTEADELVHKSPEVIPEKQIQAPCEEANSCQKNVVNAPTGVQAAGSEAAVQQNPVTTATGICPLSQLRKTLASPPVLTVQSQPVQYPQMSTLLMAPTTQPAPSEVQCPFVRVAMIQTVDGGCYLLVPRAPNLAEGSQPPAQQNVVENVQETVVKASSSSSQTKAPPRTPYITIAPKVSNTVTESPAKAPIVCSSPRSSKVQGLPPIQPPLRTYSKNQPSIKILRIDSSQPQLVLTEGKKMVVTTGDMDCVHPTYWSLVPHKERIRVLFSAESGGMNVYNPQPVLIDKPQGDNTPFGRWLRTVLHSGTGSSETRKRNTPFEVAQDPKPAARIKVKSFARMTDEDMEQPKIAPDRVAIRNQLYQKFSDKPLAYAEMLTVLPDITTAKNLIAAKIPVFLLMQSGVIQCELNSKTLMELYGESHRVVKTKAKAAGSGDAPKVLLPIVKLAGTIKTVNPPKLRRNSTVILERPVRTYRSSTDLKPGVSNGTSVGESKATKDNASQVTTSGDGAKQRYIQIRKNVSVPNKVHGPVI